MEKTNKIRVTNVIKNEDINSWSQGSNILISAGTGVGKSYFCKNNLYDIAKAANGKILMLIHRANCVEQFKNEVENDGKKDIIHVVTYQSLEYCKLKNTHKYNLDEYQYIICDEFHYFFNDSSFNNKTAVSFEMIINQDKAIKLFMSATGEDMSRYMKRYVEKHDLPSVIEYEIPRDFSFISKLTFFNKDSTMEEFIKEAIEQKEKGIFFIQSAEKAYKLYMKFKKYCLFNCSANNKKYYDYVDKDKICKVLENQRFEELIMITTACFDAGINLIDYELKHIVIDITDISSLIQCIGRKRVQNVDDKVYVYIKTINNQKLSGLKRSMEQKVEMADYYIHNDYSMDKLLEKYPLQNDVNNILYDDFKYDNDGKVIKNSYSKKVNELMYFKKKQDIGEFSLMIKRYGKFGYCKYLAKIFGFYDENNNKYTYRTINEEYGLEKFLEKMVTEEVILLNVKDRTELIKKINVKSDGKLLKNKETLNRVLEEREINFQIKEFRTSRTIDKVDNNTGKVKKIKKWYKAAWKVIRVNTGYEKEIVSEIEGG